jgi:hypothetical protein
MQNLIAQDGRWKPKQIHALTLLANPLDKRTEEEKCREVGVTQKTLIKWKKLPGFIDEIHNMSIKYIKERLPHVNYALLTKAISGDVQAIKLCYEMVGKYSPTFKVNADVRMAHLDLTKEMLSGLAESIIRTKNSSSEGTGEERPILSV